MQVMHGQPCKNALDPNTGEQVRVPDAGPQSVGGVGDNLQAYLPGDRRRALAEGRTLPDRVQGSALFADISGFTPLTEALLAELEPQRGAEELAATLTAIVDPLLAELDRHGGDVIYFSGDAVTAWIDGDDGAHAVACALAMQQLMATVGERTTPDGRVVRLGLKVAARAADRRHGAPARAAPGGRPGRRRAGRLGAARGQGAPDAGRRALARRPRQGHGQGSFGMTASLHQDRGYGKGLRAGRTLQP